MERRAQIGLGVAALATAGAGFFGIPKMFSSASEASTTPTPTAVARATGAPTPESTPTPQPVSKIVCKDQKGSVDILGMQVWYYDRTGGIKGVFEKGIAGRPSEPWIERPGLGGGLLARKPGSNEAINPQDFSPAVPNIPGFNTIPELKQNLAFAHVKIGNIACTGDMTAPNGVVVPAVELEVTSSQDPKNNTFRRWVPLGGLLRVWFGRREDPVAFQTQIENGGPVRDLTDDAKKEIADAAQKARTK